MQEQRTSNSVTEHTNDMVIHTDLCNRVSSREDVFECTNGYHTADFFLTVIFFMLEKIFWTLLFGFQSTFFFHLTMTTEIKELSTNLRILSNKALSIIQLKGI